jgi:hypothetical protein
MKVSKNTFPTDCLYRVGNPRRIARRQHANP